MAEFMRDGVKVWPYCSDCGCRLNIVPGNYSNEVTLVHFGMSPTKDARGCICSKRFEATYLPAYKVEEFI